MASRTATAHARAAAVLTPAAPASRPAASGCALPQAADKRQARSTRRQPRHAPAQPRRAAQRRALCCAPSAARLRRRLREAVSRGAPRGARAPHLAPAGAALRRGEQRRAARAACALGGRLAAAPARAAWDEARALSARALTTGRPRTHAPTAGAQHRRAAEAPPLRRARPPGARAAAQCCAGGAHTQCQAQGAARRLRTQAPRVPLLHAADAGEGGDVRWPLDRRASARHAARRAERPMPARRRLHVATRITPWRVGRPCGGQCERRSAGKVLSWQHEQKFSSSVSLPPVYTAARSLRGPLAAVRSRCRRLLPRRGAA